MSAFHELLGMVSVMVILLITHELLRRFRDK